MKGQRQLSSESLSNKAFSELSGLFFKFLHKFAVFLFQGLTVN